MGGSIASAEDFEATLRSFRATGLLIAVLGLLAILFPFLAGVSVTLVLGATLAVGAVIHAAHALRARVWRGLLGQGLLALVYAAAGVWLLANPVLGLAAVTSVVIGYLLLSGLVETMIGLRIQGDPNWGWVVFSGALSVVLGILLLAGFPGTAAWALGLLLGVNLVSTGSALLLVGRGAREAVASDEADRDAGASN
ncbi:HdeD family acid-resistance protein [Halobaculum litoreum]|uniref:HdeD family acid-resistance protein n=1 Tax=Halobaculum litoreum TaxID=3031998 RepID=A0ABD5XY52_9EURY